ncbi:MAG: hypothetical protein GY821_00660, partial [Gammaproteobacteria bacterium]|nr:hypothetical protein [Gammaproteobacteria bacterium]
MQPNEKVAKGTHFELYPGEANKATSIIREQFDDSSGFLRIKYKKTTNGLRAYYHNLPHKHQEMLKILRAGMPQSIGCPDLDIPGDVHEGIYLELAVALASETFGSVILLVDDYIQRFTYQLYDTTLSAVAAKNMAIEEGKKWIERNKPIIGKFENVEALLIPIAISFTVYSSTVWSIAIAPTLYFLKSHSKRCMRHRQW